MRMKCKLMTFLMALLLLPMGIIAQTYQQLWKQVEEAQQKDLPQTAIRHLQEIEVKAQKEGAYGHLLKSTLLHSRLLAEVAPDSLRPAVVRLKEESLRTKDEVVKAVYDAVLSKVYENNAHALEEDAMEQSKVFREQALAHAAALARVKTDDYVPFVIKGQDSKTYYGDDLLSVVGSELEAWKLLHDFYTKAGNRRAACLTGVNAFDDIASLDSLAEVYGDLPEACEIAIKRLNMMGDNFAVEQRVTYLRKSLERWGSWQRANHLRNMERELTRPMFTSKMPKLVAMPQEPQTIRIEQIRNVESLTMQVYRTSLKGDTKLDPEDDYKKLKSQLKICHDLTRTLHFKGHQDYEFFKDSVELPGLEPGVYVIEFSSAQTETSRRLYFVSGVRILTQSLPQDQVRYVVVDARTGQPIPQASLRLTYRGGWNSSGKTETLTCNGQGEVTVSHDDRNPSEVFAYTSTDAYNLPSGSYGRYSFYERQYNAEHTNLFTDRSIYRPGQTVYVTAIVWQELSALDNVAVANKRVKVELRDANNKLVAEKWLLTDRYGKCATEMTLPKGLLNGRFTVRANNGSTSFSVEEYKRPTFQVEFSEYKDAYQAGDTVRTEGKALSYTGAPVQDAKVHYTVKRRVAFWWMNYSWYWQSGYIGRGLQEETVNEGDVVTGDDGTFCVDVPLVLPESLTNTRMFYHFVVEADVTDVAGETHSGTQTLPLGSKPTALTCDLPQQVRSDQLPKVTFTRRNAAGQEIEGQVRYRIDGGKWRECAANVAQQTSPWKLKSGEHRLEAVCGDDEVDMKFVVFGLDNVKPAFETHDWFYVSHNQFPNDGTPVTLQVGSVDPDLHIVYGIFAGDKVIESGVVKKNGELLNRKFTYQEEYGNGLLVTYAWMKNDQCYVHQQSIKRPMPDKKLRLTWETFRDRLVPGQQEEWRLKVVNPDGTPADASLMAVLYDKSLDQIRQHQWTFTPTNYLSQPFTRWNFRSTNSLQWMAHQRYQPLLKVNSLTFSSFDDSVLPTYRSIERMLMRGSNRLYKTMASPAVMEDTAVSSMGIQGNDESAKEVVMYDVVDGGQGASDEANAPDEKQEVQLRENLNETAFCYPLLKTDKDGQVVMAFTLPESLTTWRLMGVAHTAQMLYGSIEGEAVAKKDIMIQPNVPRFVRMGDEAQVSARIFNTGEKSVSGKARLTLRDPESNAVVFEQEVPFSVEGEKTASALFKLDASVFSSLTTQLLICQVTAAGEGFSDGEQHYLLVLPDREYVTKTVPYTQHEPGVKTIDLKALFPQGTTQQKLTIEYTNNPAWLMVQALPVVGQPWEHSAIDQAASYYSNQLAKTLLSQSPEVKTVFEQWQREAENAPSTLHSQLEKNEELKDLVLNETPWMAAADRETEQKQRLADFFDSNAIGNRLATALEKLQKLQNADGSFSWYPGMQGSTSITVAVEEMLVRLQQMTGVCNDLKEIQRKAFGYIGKEMVELVAEMKKQEKKGHKPTFPSFTALRWLYLCAVDGRQLPDDVKKANDYLIVLLKKDIKRQTIYEKALTSIVLAKHGEHKKAGEYVQSLKEYTVYTEEMGRYYDTQRASYSWYDYKIPTEVAAIEAIQAITPQDVQTVDEMRRWLLQEKRTQAWDTPINSVNAIWAFLNDNKTLLAPRENTVLAIDGTPVNTLAATAGLGYVKTAVNEPQGRIFTATKTSEGTSWGAVYAQYLQRTSEVESSHSGITIRREVIAPQQPCKVGDRIKVRITIETARDLDFVQVVDRRAACMEPVRQLSGYQGGAYISPKDYATTYYYYGLAKGKHVIETEYYIDRAGKYESGTCTVQCAYAPEYRATAPSTIFIISE